MTNATPVLPAYNHLPDTGPVILALMGEKQVGKTTIASILQTEYGFHRVRFADPFKEMLTVLGVSREHVDGRKKEEPLDVLCGKSARFAMTTLGSEWRDMIGKRLWANILIARLAEFHDSQRRFVVVDDMRFPHELDALQEAFPGRVHVIRVTAQNTPKLSVLRWLCRRVWGRNLCRLLSLPMTEGEAYWPVLPADIEIDNSESMAVLYGTIHAVLHQYGIATKLSKPQRLRCAQE